MQKFLDQNILLQNNAAKKMYHDFAGQMLIALDFIKDIRNNAQRFER
jgi:hypothetical protein